MMELNTKFGSVSSDSLTLISSVGISSVVGRVNLEILVNRVRKNITIKIGIGHKYVHCSLREKREKRKEKRLPTFLSFFEILTPGMGWDCWYRVIKFRHLLAAFRKFDAQLTYAN